MTPARSPEVSVIQENPACLLPAPPSRPPRSSTPTATPASSEGGSWDNFLDSPTYQGLDQEFWGTRQGRQVQLVSTDISELENLSSSGASVNLDRRLELSQGDAVSDQQVTVTATNMTDRNAIMNTLRAMETKVRDMCEELDPDLIDEFSALSMDNELQKINEAKDKYRDAVRNFLTDFSGEVVDTERDAWNAEVKSLVDDVKKKRFSVLSKVNQLLPRPAPMSEFEKASIALQEKQFNLQQQAADARRNDVYAVSRPLKKLVLEKVEEIEAELDQVSIPAMVTGDDQHITRIMQKLAGWKLQVESLNNLYQDLLVKTAVHPLDSKEQSEVSAAVIRVKDTLAKIVSTAEDEDLKRELYSLDTSNKGEQVKWPVFGGEVGEDFFKFKRDFLDAAKQNKTSSKNQITKLRENIKGYAKSLVPASVTEIIKGLEILENACGDTLRVVNHRVENLMKVGPWPNEGTKDCYSKQVKWIIKVQALLQEIIDLANTEQDLGDVIYNREKLSQILKLFPTFMVDKLSKIPGYKEEKYVKIIEKLGEWKAVSQNRDLIYNSSPSSASQPQSKPSKADPPTSTPSGHINFPQPKRFPGCRICAVLKSQGVTAGLFDNHVSDYATGCPKFASLGTDQRMVIAREAKFCINCMGKDTKYSFQHNKDCPIKKKKSFYSCKKSSCMIHMWLCSKHQEDNEEQMVKFEEQLLQKSGIKLVFITRQKQASTPPIPRSGVTPPPTSNSSVGGTPPPHSPTSPSQPVSPMSYCAMGEKGIKQAVRKLHRINKKKDPSVETISPPVGTPLFLFQPVEGITDPVNVFYDKGCSDAVFRAGIPGVQLRGTLLAKGPFEMGGVGGITTTAEEEWLVQFTRTDNKKQLVRGVTMQQITCDFPAIDTTEAVKEIKSEDKNDEFLQSCKVPMIAGGKVDILLGIQYSIIHPLPVLELNCGLTIYRSRLVSHNSVHNALIGGPHTSFQFLANKAGNAANLLAHFTEGLKSLRTFGPPKIPSNPMTLQEEMFAIAHNAQEYKEVRGFGSEREQSKDDELCVQCLLVSIEDCPETMREIRRMRLEQEGGVDINYRCIKCRDCTECKDSDKTEAISLREEAEMEMIDKSVSLDFENKRINCSLPLKGEEKQFLTNNYGKARKILEQQVKEYSNQQETKEMILKAFSKLFDNGHAAFIDNIPSEERAMFANKEIQYYIPWRIQFSDSVTTPARPVLDASSRTRRRPDGSGGQSLNDLVCQGKVETLNLLNLVLNFRVGKFAVTGDLQQFYNACKLTPSQWNLQRFLFQPDMDPSSPVLEGVIKTLIYGVTSVSAQSENTMKKLGTAVKDEKPDVQKLIEKRRYVDDLGDSKITREECVTLTKNADEVFARVSLKCKSWTFSGEKPDSKVSKDGVSVTLAGSPWYPELDVFVVKVPPLHFGKRKRGRLDVKTKFFTGSTMEDMDEFTPSPLNRKQVSSKFASIWDLTGKLGPVLAEAKELLSSTITATEDWVSPMPPDLRDKWVAQFLLWEKLRGLHFERAVMPPDAKDNKMRLIVNVDASNKMLVQGCWAGFKKKDGSWSCQHILSRILLAGKNSTIPKSELQALTNGSNMCWLVRKMLADWVDHYIICGDSVIALCWVSSEKKSLSMFHRNRVIQIRRSTELDHIYHVKTEQNLADLATRPEKVRLSDVGPDSEWECGKLWMKGDVLDAVQEGILKPISNLRISAENEKEEFKEGLVFGGEAPDLFCNAVTKFRVEQLQLRVEYSDYLLLPTKFQFRKVVRIMAIVMGFIRKCRRNKGIKSVELSSKFKFTIFHLRENEELQIEDSGDDHTELFYNFQDRRSNTDTTFARTQTERSRAPEITGKYLHDALVYLFRRGTKEVIHFNSKVKVDKVGAMKDGILFSKGRIVEGMNFVQTGGLEIKDLGSLGIKSHLPVIDRHSPLAYSIANHIHWNIARHRGMETCNRISMEHVNILQGPSLYREIGEECLRCKMRRKKYVEMPMGLISDHQLNICPPFWVAQMDIFGPIGVYVPGFERKTRNRQVLEAKCWVLVFACPVTRLLNLQVIEKSDSSGVVDGLTRLSCEVGIPKILLMDQDTALIKAMSEVEVNFKNLELKLHEEWGVEFFTCPVSGHNQHGQVERRIRTVQESLSEAGLESKRLHATGLQTLMKLVENQLNNLPLGYSYGREQDNTPLLRMLTPNMLRMGRNNDRALEGPLRLPAGGELLDRVQGFYEAWFKIWNVSYIPKLMYQPKWWKKDKDLKEGDIVLFQKKESALDTSWTLGTIDQLVVGRDGLARRAVVKYQNFKEEFQRVTDRHIRSLVKVWSMDDQNIDEDLAELHRRLSTTQQGCDLLEQLLGVGPDAHAAGELPQTPAGPEPDTGLVSPRCGQCCCDSHCRLLHPTVKHVTTSPFTAMLICQAMDLQQVQLQTVEGDHSHSEDEGDDDQEESFFQDDGSLTSLISSLNLNLH